MRVLAVLTMLVVAAGRPLAAEEPAAAHHWLEGRWETRSLAELGPLIITRAPDGTLQIAETVKSDEWNDSRSLGLAEIEVTGSSPAPTSSCATRTT